MWYEDLNKIRGHLDDLNARIASRLDERSKYVRNDPVYEINKNNPSRSLVYKDKPVSMLALAIEGLELYHHSLGRWYVNDQKPLMFNKEDLDKISKPNVIRETSQIPKLPDFDTPSLRDNLVPFYVKNVVGMLCKPGEDNETKGETVDSDAYILELMNERINVGRYVAVDKIMNDSSLYDVIGSPDKLEEKLRRRDREKKVISDFSKLLTRSDVVFYGPGTEGKSMKKVRNSFAKLYIEWLIEQTIGLETRYLKGLVEKNGKAGLEKYKSERESEKTKLDEIEKNKGKTQVQK